MTNDLFNSADPDNGLVNEIETLKSKFVKEDGTIDADALLKAKAHADRHIRNIETEQAGLREDLKTRLTLEEIAAKIEASKNVNSEPQINTPSTPQSEVDIDKLVDAKLSAYQKEQLYEQNINYVSAELTKAWGPDFQSKLVAKARELGESQDNLIAMAQSKPKLFLTLVGATGTANNSYTSAPTSSVRSNGSFKQAGKTYSDFRKLRRENPQLYWSQTTQKEMHKLNEEYAARGEDFTKT